MRQLLALSSLAVLAACVAPSTPPPAPQPVPVPAPAPAPAPPPPIASSDWRDWPVTPGNWRYSALRDGTVAAYERADRRPLLAIMCMRSALSVTRFGLGAGPMTVRTSSNARTLAGQRHGDGAEQNDLLVMLPANDALIDAMGYSRGRFIVETPGAAPLVIPAWAEVLRVAEDCRR